jgi:hypothetical protein
MPLTPLSRRLEAAVVDARLDPGFLVVRFAPRSGRREIEDCIPLGPPGELDVVRGVGRLLRVLRAARLKPPNDPYALGAQPQRAVELVQRCRGAVVLLRVAVRIERVLTVWTDEGVDHIGGIVDVEQNARGLSIRRRRSPREVRIPRRRLVRFATTTAESPEVLSVEIPRRIPLR